MNTLNKILDEIKNQKITILGWGLSFVGILFVRFILESLSSPTATGIIPSDPYTLIHYILFFLSLTIGTSIILGYFTKDYTVSPKIILFGLPLLWLAPIVDIIFSHGKGYRMMYVFDTGNRIIFNFFTFFGTNFTSGATYGMRIGIALSIIGIGFYIWLQSKKIVKSVLGALVIYILVFIVGSLPGVIYTLSHINSSTSTNSEVVFYLEKIINQSTIYHNTLREGVSSVSRGRLIELTFDKLISQILFILSFVFAGFLFWKIDSKKFWVIIKNARLERVNFYTASLLCGMGFAYINNLGNKLVWIDIFGVLCLIFSWISLWMYAVHTNDVIDIEIDKISNKNRPLVKKEVDKEEMGDIGKAWLAFALLGSWCAGFYPFFMSLVYVATSYIYSSPPLRLRRFPIVSSFLIGIACLSTILAGFFFISVYKQIQAFPILLAVGIVVMVTLAINFKDIKDIEGDKENGIVTLPILFGKNGVKVVAVCFAISILTVPFFLSFPLLYFISIPSAIAGYKIITQKPYREKPIFVLRFVFLASIGFFYILFYYLAHVYNLI
ncbi:MAG: UbiA family prenyltransferase [Nitrospira sp.]